MNHMSSATDNAKRSDKIVLSRFARTLIRDLRAMRDEAGNEATFASVFADWLVDSFAASPPTYRDGRFYQPDEELLFNAVAAVQEEVAPHVGDALKDGVAAALRRFPAEGPTWRGLLEIYGLAEVLNVEDAPEWIAVVLSRRLPKPQTAAAHEPRRLALPETVQEAAALQELGECVFRQVWHALRQGDLPERFRPVCAWAHGWLVDGHTIPAGLVPTLAPLAVLAVAHASASDPGTAKASADKVFIVLQGKYLRPGDPLEPLYSWGSKQLSARFPYHLDGLKGLLDLVADQGSGGRPSPLVGMMDSGDPLDPAIGARATAGRGGRMSVEEAEEYVDVGMNDAEVLPELEGEAA